MPRLAPAILLLSLALVGAGCPPSATPTPSATPAAGLPTASPAARTLSVAAAKTKTMNLGALSGAHAAFAVSLTVPVAWEAEVVPSVEAINLYDPAAAGNTLRERSQVFLRHFSANDFLTLSTVTIHERTRTTIAGRPAVSYSIEKKAGVADFSSQPSWRNARHQVTDVRLRDANPSEFLVFGKRPELSDTVFADILASLVPMPTGAGTLVFPVTDAAATVTKKPFGIHITPATSPVQPERFSGYHTGADMERPADTSVVAVADGTVVRSEWVSGYGGMVAIEHRIGGERIVGIYGHMDPASLPNNGATVRAGEEIGVLGQAGSTETDGERAHLHFALSTGVGVDIRGYVPTTSLLSSWRDPIAFLNKHSAAEPSS